MSPILSRLFRKAPPTPLRRPAQRQRRGRKLTVEILEDRIALAMFTVTSSADSGAGTLREAIDLVNAEATATYGSPHVINFNIAGDPTITLEANLPDLTNYWVLIDGSNGAQPDVTVNGNGYAMLPFGFNSGTILDHVTFTGGGASLGADAYIEIRAGATLSVTGDLLLADGAVIENYGTLAVSGDLGLANDNELYNGFNETDAATLTVGGDLDGGSGILVYNAGTSSFTVDGHFDMGDGSGLYNGYNLTDAATLTVGGYFSTNDFVGNIGTSTINVAGNFTINTDSGGFGGNLENGNGFFAGGDVTLIVGGDFSAGGDVNNWGTSTLSVAGDCTIGLDLTNGYTATDAATLTVGGNYFGIGFGSVSNAGASVLRVDGDLYLNNFGGAYNYDSSTLLVQGDFTVIGANCEVYNGFAASDAAILTVGGNFSMEADSYVYTIGTNPFTVAGNFTLGANSYFEDFGSMAVGGNFDPGTGAIGFNNSIGGTFTAMPGSNATTNTSTWEVLADGVLEVENQASFTIAPGGALLVDALGTLVVASGATFTEGGSSVQYSDDYHVNWTWTGYGGDGNWDNAANWNAVPSPNWIGGPTNAYPGQGAIAGELDFVTIDTGATAATITVRAPDDLSVRALSTAANDTLAITGGTLNVLGSSRLRGSLAMTGGTLAVQGNRTSVKVTGATTVTGASLSATGGATLSLPNLSSYANTIASNPTSFTADGAGSLLDLPGLATLGTLDSSLTIHALAEGVVNLSRLSLDGVPNIIQDIQSGGHISTQDAIVLNSKLTITEGAFTGTPFNLLPGAKLVIMGGAFGATFDVAAGANITIFGGTFTGTTFNLAPGANVAVFGGTFSGTTTWNVDLGATVTVSGFPTVSGTWIGTGLGTVQLSPWRLYIDSGGLNLNFAGDMLQWTGGVIDAGLGNLTNLGTIHLVGAAAKGFYNDGTFDNFGTIIQEDSGNLVLGTSNLFPCILKNELGALYQIEGTGGVDQLQDHFGSDFFPSIENAGTIRKLGGTGVSTIHLDGTITNTGTIEAASGTLYLNVGSLAQVSGGTLTGGVWNALNGATLQFPVGTNITTNAASISLGGAGASMTGIAGLNSSSGSFTVADGASFTTAGHFSNSGALTVGVGSTLDVSGNFTQTAGGVLNEHIGGTPGSGQFGQIAVTSNAALAGQFHLDLVNSFGPSAVQDFPVLTFASASGGFTSFTGLNPFFTQTQDATSLHLVNSSTNAVDLQLSNPTAPTTATTGQQISVNWTVNNPGGQDASGNWKDSVYLSTTPTVTASSILLGAVQHSGGLAAGQFYNGAWTGAVPAVAPGFYYVIVQADSLYQVADPVRTNNTLAASTGQINVSLPVLTLGTPLADSFTAANQDRYYQVDVPVGGTLQIALASSAGSGATALYVSQGVLPTPFNFQHSANTPNQPNQTLTVPQVLTGGTYYVLAHSVSGASATAGFTLTATQTSALTVTAISSYAGSSGASVTIEIDGTNFAANATASLTPVGGGTPLVATAINFVSASKMYATFNLVGATPFGYTLEVQQGAQSATAPTTFQVLSLPPSLTPPTFGLVTPEVVRSGRTGEIVITYSNPSNNDLIAPLLLISSTNPDVLFSTSDDPNNYVSSTQILAVAPTGPAGILRPGQRGQLTVTLQSNDPADGNDIPITVSQIEAGQTIDWAALESNLRPSSIPVGAWDVIFANFVDMVGTTTDSLNAALAQTATYLGNLGEPQTQVGNVNRLWAFLMAQADANFPVTTLASDLDAALPTPGSLPLAIDRTFASSIASSYKLGIFGLGWATSWQTSLSADSSGNVTTNNGGTISLFVRQANGTYLNTSSAYGALTLAGGIYTFTNIAGTQYVFLANGLLNYQQDTNGNRITLGYNGQAQLITLTYSNPSVPSQPAEQLTLTYNLQGFVSQVADGTGNVWTYAHDPAGHLLSVTAPGPTAAGLTTTYSYSPGGNALASITRPDGSQENFTYDAQGRLSSTSTNGGAEATTYTYLGEAKVKTTDSAGHQTIVWYNDLGLPGQVQDALGSISTLRYDNNGNLVAFTDAAGRRYQYTYDRNGNRTQILNPLGQTVQMSYGAFNRLLSITDAAGNITRYSHDAKGNQRTITYADSTKHSFTYDPLGNLAATVLQNGDPIGYQYNAQGLMTQATLADGTIRTFTYDAHGNMLTAEDASGITTLVYNTADQLLSITYPDGRSLAFTYDGTTGQRLTSVDQSGYTLIYSYDTLGRPSGLSDGSGMVVQYTYNNLGQLSTKTNGNGTYTTYAYNAAGSLTSEINYANLSGTIINSSFTHTYNIFGQVTSVTDGSGNVTSYSYDAIGQLTGVNMPGQTITYAYNAAGNRTQVTVNGTPTLYTSNSANEITTVGSATYIYDANGNLHTVTDASGTTTYNFNDLNQLVSIAAPDGTTTSFQYSPLGFMIGTTTTNGATTNQTNYLVDPTLLGNVVSSYTGSGSLIAHYNYGFDLVSQTGPSGTGYYDFDQIGNTVGITGAAGNYVNQYSYLPFGETTVVSAALPNPFSFSGQFGVMQVNAGLFSMHARHYTPATGQFLSNDPIGLAGGDLNVRKYASNEPLQHIDPSGLADVIHTITKSGTPYTLYQGQAAKDYAAKHNMSTNNVDASTTTGDGGAVTLFYNGMNPDVRAHEAQHADDITDQGVLLWTFFISKTRGDAAAQNYLEKRGYSAGKKAATNPKHIAEDEVALKWIHDNYDKKGINDQFAPATQGNTKNRLSHDPNALIGPAGYGTPNYIQDSGVWPYTIQFENTGSIAAQDVIVTQQLDADLDWSTFELGSFGFGALNVFVPTGLTQYQTGVDYQNADGSPLNVLFTADFNVQTGLLTVTYNSLDPLKNFAPEGVFDGFLYPEDGTGVGEGYVQYIVEPKSALATGTPIDATASIVFDTNDPIATNTHTNTIDNGSPSSSVSPLDPVSDVTFTVSWTGNDDSGGSGIAFFDIYVSDNGGSSYALWKREPGTTLSDTFVGVDGLTYRFYSVAIDNVGNTDAAPEGADATTTVSVADTEAPTVNLTAPAFTNDTTPSVTVSATDALSGVPDGTAVALDVDLNNDDDFDDTGEMNYSSSTLTGGTTTFAVGPTPLTANATYKMQARVSDQAGNEGTSSSKTVVVDTAAPTGGTVNDGTTPPDIDFQTSLTTLIANWSGFSDAHGVSYEWAIGTSAGGSNILAFTGAGISGATATASGLSLNNGIKYYVTVRAFDAAGNQTDATSDGVTVDTTPPTAGTVNDGATPPDIDFQTSLTTLIANWSGFSDANGVSYEWTIGTSVGGSNILAFTSTGISGTTATATGLSLSNSTKYYVTVRAFDPAGNQTDATSDGVTVDTTPPTAGTVNDGATTPDIDFQTSVTTLSANWSGFSDANSISSYRWAIGTSAGGSNILAFTSTGVSGTTATATGLSLNQGTKYYVTVRAFDAVGNQTDATSDGVTVATASFTANASVPQGTPAQVQFSNVSPTDRFSYDFNNDGDFTDPGEILNSAAAAATVPGSYLVGPGMHTIHGRLTTSGGPSTDYTTTVVAVETTDTVGIFNPANATWYFRNGNGPGAPDVNVFAYGFGGVVELTGDWDGDGVDTIGVYDPRTAMWYLRNSNSPGAPNFTPFAYGFGGVIPVVGDWNGDGIDTIGVFNPANATWYLRNSNSAGAPDITPFAYGFGAKPVVGDWNGDGMDTVGVYSTSNAMWYLRNSNSAGAPNITPFAYGFGTNPVVGDWNGDGIDTVGIYNPSNAGWYLRDSNNPGAPTVPVFGYGFGTRPVVGNWFFSPLNLASANGELTPSAAADLTAGELDTMKTAALTRLQNLGVDPVLLARLQNVSFEIGNLLPGLLAQAFVTQQRVVFDANATGHGWFVDSTPQDDSEFPSGVATAGPAAGRMDLLTVALRELGHMAGRDNLDPNGHATDLLSSLLGTGTRRTALLTAVFAGH